jgi:hypothetical protein
MVLQILHGATGAVEKESRPTELLSLTGEGPNWVHQRILVANLRGTATPQDFIIKLGTTTLAFDDQLNVLWAYTNSWDEYANCPAYVPAVGDMDGDGRDETNGGYFLLGPDGRPIWEEKLGKNMDAVAIDLWDDGTQRRAFASAYGHVLSKSGDILLKLGEEAVPHGQELRVGDFSSAHPGNEMIIRYNGHSREAMLVLNNGTIAHRFLLNESPNNTGMETVYFHGRHAPAWLYNGGMLWKGDGSQSAALPGLPPPQGNKRQGWYHCIPANVAGDDAEEVIVYNPWSTSVYIYSHRVPKQAEFGGYRATPRQYNVRLLD